MKKILLIRFSSIGDIVLTTPIIRTVKKKFADVELHFLTKKSFEGLVSENPYLSKIISLDHHWVDMISQLTLENYDFIIDLHKNLRSKRVAFSLKKPVYSFHKLNIKKWLWVHFKWNLMPQKHLVDRYFEGLKKLGMLDDGEGLDFFLPKNFLWNNEINIPSQFVVYAIGGTFTTKKMPFEKMSELLENTQTQVLLIGGKEDVAMGEKLGAFTIGHTLVWHQQTPAWVFQSGEGQFLNGSDLIKRMEDHISTLVGRYKGKIDGWDGVNEAFEDDGTWRKTHWYNITGTEFIKAAFRKAHEVDPNVELYYNDYNVWKPEKREAILAFAKELRAEGIRIDGIGMQGHYRLNSPSLDQIEQAILDIHEAGFQVHVTELDVDVLPRPNNSEGADLNINYAESEEWNPYKNGLPAEVEQQLVDRYVSIFKIFRKHANKISRVTFWGLHDGRSWLNNWPVRGRTNYALIFDRQMNLKPGFVEWMGKR